MKATPFSYNKDAINNVVREIRKSQETIQAIRELLAHDEFEYPFIHENGLPRTIVLLGEQEYITPCGQCTTVDEYLENIESYHEDVELFESHEPENAILFRVCLKTELNLGDIEAVYLFHRQRQPRKIY